MKTTLKLALVALTLAAPCAQASMYVGVNAGFFTDSEELTLSTRLGSVVAQSGTSSHLVEGEVLLTEVKEDGLKLSLVPVMLNYRFRAELAPKFGVEVGAGIGYSFTRFDAFGESDDDGAFAYQLLAGVTFAVSEQMSLYAGIRHLDIGKATLFGFSDDIGYDTSLEVGVRFGF